MNNHARTVTSLASAASSASAQSDLYDRVAHETARGVIYAYSTSFGMATKLLSQPVRGQVEDIYALVRLADEIVDGVAATAGVPAGEIRRMLDELETETERAVSTGYSTNLVVHAFARTARATGITPELTRPFFASMRADITESAHTPESFDAYVYGSAEVVGLMCLQAFLAEGTFTPTERERFVAGARALGAAFQKVNFLRDLSADVDALGRSYFPGIAVSSLTDEQKMELVANIDADLRVSAAVVPDLPASSRRAVALAQSLFAELNRRIARTPASALKTTRVRVPNPVKVRLALIAILGKARRP